MITDELLERINKLAHKKKTTGLNAEELAEQKKLYEIYLSSIRKQVTDQLDGMSASRECNCRSNNCSCGQDH